MFFADFCLVLTLFVESKWPLSDSYNKSECCLSSPILGFGLTYFVGQDKINALLDINRMVL